MGLENRIRRFQDRVRNQGWRIENIPWQPDGKPEYYYNSKVSLVMVLLGLAGFFGGIILLSQAKLNVYQGIGVSAAGLLTLLLSRFVAGYQRYRHFLPVTATCIDREVREFEDPDSYNSLNKITYWFPRVLCEYAHDGRTYRVTPVIAVVSAFRTEQAATRFLDERIDENRRCKLWINPENPLQTAFHQKPKAAVHTT